MRVAAKNAAFPQRFIISGATSGNGTYNGVTTTAAVPVTGSQWTIAIQHNPGGGFQLSKTKLKFPQQVGGNYQFDIQSDDSGGDGDFNDLILTCWRPATPNDFIVYGNVSLYSGGCVFNPCRKDIFVLETPSALEEALKNSRLREIIEKLYPERVPPFRVDPNPPDPPYFMPVVLDLFGEAMQPKTTLNVSRVVEDTLPQTRGKTSAKEDSASAVNFRTEEIASTRKTASESLFVANRYEIAQAIDRFPRLCSIEPGYGLDLRFEEYDRTTAEKAGGPYTGTGDRRLLGDTVSDMYGNYIFHFRFDMTFPFLDDETDDFPGQTPSTYAYPDVIVKVIGASGQILYESAPYYNIPNLKRINICLPKNRIRLTSSCVNDNLIGSIGNVALGGSQNTTASTSTAALTRNGYFNYLDDRGIITVGASDALFDVQCAAWSGTIDIIGCIYDETKPLAENKIRYYTIRIKRKGAPDWRFVDEQYKHQIHPTGEGIVGSSIHTLRVDGGAPIDVPAYRNIRYELHAGIALWKESHIDRLIQLNTALYDGTNLGASAPGTFYLRIDGYDAAGNPVPGETDMIALYIHNKPLNFGMEAPILDDSSIVFAGCGLYRLTEDQNSTPMKFKFKANDFENPLSGIYAFVNSFKVTMSRCPGSTIALQVDPSPPLTDTAAGATDLSQGTSNSTRATNCPGYTGTKAVFGTYDLVEVTLQPVAGEGWIKPAEYFTKYNFTLSASKRATNGYNVGVGGPYPVSSEILMERLT